MPHLSVKCCPKHLNDAQMQEFVGELTELLIRHLGVTEENISIDYTEVQPDDWQQLYDQEIKPRLDVLVKKPGYQM